MIILGIDEAGRGPLVGSVVAAGVILNPDRPIQGLVDSKKLTAKRRELLALEIQQKALDFTVKRIVFYLNFLIFGRSEFFGVL